MGSSEAEGSSPTVVTMTTVIDELTKGRESVATLATLLLVDPPESPAARVLLEEIMNTISKAISVLESGKCQDGIEAPVESLSSDVSSRAPGEKRKIQRTRKSTIRKRGNPYSWTRVTSSTIEDGRTWRKYGQKEIFSAKHPRSYFRCTYKYDRGCNATRQVQKSEDNPSLYVITYFGEHTCVRAEESIPSCRETHLISFESNIAGGINTDIPFSSFAYHKQENEEEVVSNLTTSDSPLNWFEPLGVELQNPSIIGLESGWSDSLQGLNSPITSYDLEFMDLEEIFSYDQNEIFTW